MVKDEGDFHASVFILRPDRKTVLVRKERDGQQPGEWTFPGGKKRQRKDFLSKRRGERPAETVVREVQEETGLILKKRKLVYLGHEETVNPKSGPYRKHFFFIRSYSKKILRPLSDEYERVQDFDANDLHHLEGFCREYYHQFVMRIEPYLKSL
jgi:8-oxo-dGTP pyrophosphatase MutT (NUDIX family)